MAILRPYKVNSYRRICDVCGRPRQIEDIRFADNVAICKIHPQYRTAQQLNAINSRVRPIPLLPVPQPKPFAPINTYTAEEAQVFNFITKWAPIDFVTMTVGPGDPFTTPGTTAASAEWAIIYLTGLLTENKRPSAWLTVARKVALALGERILAQQAVAGATATWLVGGVEQSLNYPTTQIFGAADAGLTCAAFCALYNLTGDKRYLTGATNAAGFVTYLQSTAVNNFAPSGWNDLGPPVAFSDEVNEDFLTGYTASSSLLCVWGLSVLKAITGDIVIGPTTATAATAPFVTARLLSTAIAQIRSFWVTGYGGFNGFSAATPRQVFNNKTLTWTASTGLTSLDWALALFALYETEGFSSQVQEIWNYLQTTTDSGHTAASAFNPKLAPPIGINGTNHTVNGTSNSLYEWAAPGLMAKIQASQDRASFTTVKETLSVPQPRYREATPRSGDCLSLGVLGRSPFDLTARTNNTGAAARIASVSRTAMGALIYRQQPQGFVGQGHA